MTVALPYRFDTANVWHTILKGVIGVNALMVVAALGAAASGNWRSVLGGVLVEIVVLGFSRIFFRYQQGSTGTLFADHVEVNANELLGFQLPGPKGTYALDRFSAIRVKFFPGPVSTEPNAGGPHEDVWLVGRPGTPDVLLATTQERSGHEVGKQFGALLSLPVEEVGSPRVIVL
jgi:hypothetical protein